MKPEEIIKACPVTAEGDYKPYVTSPYGNRTFRGIQGFHHGIDMVISHEGRHMTSPVQCCFEKAVIVFADHYGTAGNAIILLDIETSTRLQRVIACYCHLESIYDNAGDIVVKGERIGYMGGTGITSNQYSSHLHFSINLIEKDVRVQKGISGYGARDPFLFGLQKFFKSIAQYIT